MKLYTIGIIGGLILLVVLLVGCTGSQNTDEYDTQEKILNSCRPIAEKWFVTNMSDAKDITVELCDFDKKKEFCDVVTGLYYKNDKKYCYWLNVTTEEFCSEEYYDILVQYLRERLAGSLDIACKEIDIPLEAAVIHGKDDYSTRCKWAYHRFDVNEIATIADEEMSDGDKDIQIIVNAPDKVVADIAKLEILKSHTNWRFILQESRDALEYKVYYSDGKYHIARALLDDKGILRYDIYAIEAQQNGRYKIWD